MKHLKDLQIGDWVKVKYEDQEFDGQVEEIAGGQVCVRTFEDNLYWYEPQDISLIPLNGDQLAAFGFVKSNDPALNGRGEAYVKGPFTLHYVNKNDPNHIMLIYMGDHTREITEGLTVSQFQHHYHGMTKIILEKMD
jgi:hypothetical protein